MASIYDVAREANCSASTVSRALNGSSRVNENTRLHIEAVANRLGYTPSFVARSLRVKGGGSRLVGLIVPSIEDHNYSVGTSLLHDALAREGYQLLLCCHHNDSEADVRSIYSLLERGVDALVHVPSIYQTAELRATLTGQLPVVELQRYSDVPNVDAVIADAELGSYELTRFLVRLGHSRIALIAGYDFNTRDSARFQGFARAIADAGLCDDTCPTLVRPYEASWVRAGWGRDAARQILDHPTSPLPSAIICGSAAIALGVLQEFQSRGIGIPDEVSVVGLSYAEWSGISAPALTTYEFPLREMGLMAAQLLLNRLQLQVPGKLEPRVVRFAGRLIERASTATPASAE